MNIELDPNVADPNIDPNVADPNVGIPDTPIDLFSLGTPPSPQEPQPEPKLEPQTPYDNDKKRYQYWQSEADKRGQRLVALETELKQYQPILDLIQNDPETLAFIEKRAAGIQQPNQLQELKAPIPPERPTSYNEQEAYTNPASESWKFRVAQEKYLQDRLAFVEQRTVLQDKMLAQQQEQQQRAIQAQQQQRNLMDSLVKNYKFTPQIAADFIETMSAPETMSLDNLVAYYRFLKTGSSKFTPPVPGIKGTPPVPGPTDDAARFQEEMKARSKNLFQFAR